VSALSFDLRGFAFSLAQELLVPLHNTFEEDATVYFAMIEVWGKDGRNMEESAGERGRKCIPVAL